MLWVAIEDHYTKVNTCIRQKQKQKTKQKTTNKQTNKQTLIALLLIMMEKNK